MNTNKPQVSVIVTTYNREKYLRETIQSILNQTFTDFELIVVDNFSKYNFFEVMESFNDSRIKPFQNQNNGIIAVNRNFGIKKAIGKYVAFCDDDDLWDKDKLKLQYEFIIIHPKTICATSCHLINEASNLIKTIKREPYKDTKYIYLNNRISLSSVIVERNDRLIFSESKSLFAIEDWALWLDLVHTGYSIYLDPRPLLYYRWFNMSTGVTVKKIRPIKEIYCLTNIILKYGCMSNRLFVQSVIMKLLFFIYYSIRIR